MGFKTFLVILIPFLLTAYGQFECGDCLAVRNLPGCSVQEVSDCVCNSDSFCCISTWSSFCVADVFTFNCDQFCPVEAPAVPLDTRLSGGWIFTIILGSVLGTYCVFGFLFNWCCQAGSEAPFPECVPHYSFWKEVPGWVQDGCHLVVGKIQSV